MGMAAVIYKKGAPDNFVWEEIKVGSPGRGQVRLRSTAVGVNFADTYHRAGIPHPMIVGDPPVVVGFEGVGKIEELGPGVTGFSVGERVCTCLPPLGAYSQERLYPADKLIKVPKDLPLDDVQLAGLILKGMTAQYLLHRTHKVQPGDYVLIHAAAGGMGHILCPWARHLGATVIGTVSTDAKAEIARNLGCHYVQRHRRRRRRQQDRDRGQWLGPQCRAAGGRHLRHADARGRRHLELHARQHRWRH